MEREKILICTTTIAQMVAASFSFPLKEKYSEQWK
jgi:hypothetical protein